MKLGEKVSYLRGLIDGLDIDSKKEGKVIALMADVLQEMALQIEDLQDQIDEVVEVVDVIDEDLGEVERDFYEIDDCDCDDDCCCDDDDFDFLDDDDELYELVCPTCGDSIYLNEDMLDEGSMECPGCGEFLEFDFEIEDMDDDEDAE
mgnify:CR=1 FL=1